MAVALAGCLFFFGLAGILSSSRFITGTYLYAIRVPFRILSVFRDLGYISQTVFLFSGRKVRS